MTVGASIIDTYRDRVVGVLDRLVAEQRPALETAQAWVAETLRADGLWKGATPTTTEPAVAAVRDLIGAPRG